jgi:FlaA1/EpsC-like NDP-sugar epimerase
MTIPEAANLVIEAGELSSGGEVFILNMGDQVKIYDLAKRLIHLSGRNIAPDSKSEGIQIKEVGLRPGEKLYEELLISGNEDLTSNNKILISNESFLNKASLNEVLESLSIAESKHNTNKAIEILENSVEGYKYDRGAK